jgi:hypothetical protein
MRAKSPTASLCGCLLFLRRALTFPGTAHEFFDARLQAAGAIGEKDQVGNMADAEAFLQFEADVAFGGFQAGEGILLGFLNVGAGNGDGYVDPSGFTASIQGNLAYMAVGDAWIDELALDHGADLEAQGLGHAVLMMFSRSMLWHGPLLHPRG